LTGPRARRIVRQPNNLKEGGANVRPEEADLAHRLQRLVIRLNRELRWESAEIGVSSADAMVLFDLRRHPGAGVSDLAGMAQIARSVISERVKRLQAAGLVERDAVVCDDRRRVGLKITSAGHAVLTRMARIRRDRIAARLAGLSDDDRAAIEQAVDALDRLPQWRSAAELAADAQRQGRKTSGQPSEGRDQDHERRQARQT
jgi:DNA-binding MarR family transcriptional regulator